MLKKKIEKESEKIAKPDSTDLDDMMSLQNGYCITLSSINSLQLFLAKSHPIPRPQVIS